MEPAGTTGQGGVAGEPQPGSQQVRKSVLENCFNLVHHIVLITISIAKAMSDLQIGTLPFGRPSPFYEMLPHNLREAVDKASAAMFQSLRDQGIPLPISGHLDRVADEIGRWLVETGVSAHPSQAHKADAPDPGHTFMQWWRTFKGFDPERIMMGYFGVDAPTYEP